MKEKELEIFEDESGNTLRITKHKFFGRNAKGRLLNLPSLNILNKKYEEELNLKFRK